MSNESHIVPRLTADDIVKRASAGKINEYYRNFFEQRDRHERIVTRTAWTLFVIGGSALAIYEAIARGL